MKKHFLLTTILLTLFCTRLTALPVGISLSTWGASKNFASGEGTHASVGAFVALAPRLEVEASAIVSLTPTIAQDLIGSLHLSFPFAAPLYYTGGEGTLYYNGFIGLGYLGGWDDHHQRAVHALSLRVIPFTLGGSYYTRRERALAFSVLYDFVGHQWAMSWSLLGFDLYL